jgi:hypothetical protein
VKVGATAGTLEGVIEGTRYRVVARLRDLGRKKEWETAQGSFVEGVAKAERV